MSLLTLDRKNRVLLDRKIRETSGLRKGARLAAIPFKGGVILVDATRKSFGGSMRGFAFKEESHEASKLLSKEGRPVSRERSAAKAISKMHLPVVPWEQIEKEI